MSSFRIKAVIIVIPVVAIAALFLSVLLAGGTAAGTLSTGRSVTAHSDSIALSATFAPDTATIRTSGKTIVVGPTTLSVDGRTIANIKEDVADIKVQVKGGAITFLADGNPVPTILK